MSKALVDAALRQYRDTALRYGINLRRTSTCYPPGCKLHVHSEQEKNAWSGFASALAAQSEHGHKPDRTEEERS